MTEQEAIEWFKNCAFYRNEREPFKIAIQALEQTQWIPISERLPEENKTVIASTKYGVFPETKYTKEYGWEWAYEAGADYWRELEDVKAWMPLPEPYEPQERSDKE